MEAIPLIINKKYKINKLYEIVFLLDHLIVLVFAILLSLVVTVPFTLKKGSVIDYVPMCIVISLSLLFFLSLARWLSIKLIKMFRKQISKIIWKTKHINYKGEG